MSGTSANISGFQDKLSPRGSQLLTKRPGSTSNYSSLVNVELREAKHHFTPDDADPTATTAAAGGSDFDCSVWSGEFPNGT